MYGAVDLPSSAFCRRCSGFRLIAFLSRTGVQGSVPHAASLSSCQPASTRQGGTQMMMKCFLRVQATVGGAVTNDGSTLGATQSFATHTADLLDREWACCGAAFLKLVALKGRCTAENLVAASWGSAKRFELSTVLREEFPKVTTVTRNEAANMVAAGRIRDEADGWRSQPQLQTTIQDTETFMQL